VTAAEAAANRPAHEMFERAWQSALATQKELAASGWPGMVVDLPGTRPAVLKAMDAAVVAAQSVVQVAGPGESLLLDRWAMPPGMPNGMRLDAREWAIVSRLAGDTGTPLSRVLAGVAGAP
jgi:hypothetical protein